MPNADYPTDVYDYMIASYDTPTDAEDYPAPAIFNPSENVVDNFFLKKMQ